MACAPSTPRVAPSTPAATGPSDSAAAFGPPTSAPPAAVLRDAPTPATAGECPYLGAAEVSAFNGEKVYSVRLDPSFDPPACFFTRADGEPQLSVWVYRAESPELATAAVDRAAPRGATNPADQPPGWSGGSGTGADGAVYAVARADVAVVVRSNQRQSVKARRVTERVIIALAL